MDRISEALEQAKAERERLQGVPGFPAPGSSTSVGHEAAPLAGPSRPAVHVRERHLRRERIVAHRPDPVTSTAFDMLRTRVLYELDKQNWRSVFVTSPTSGCGKTVTAINLALSIARQQDRRVVLIDLDLRRPRICTALGFKPIVDLAAVLAGNGAALEYGVTLDIAPRLMVLGNRKSVSGSAELIVGRNTRAMFDSLREASDRPIVIVDTPPVLASDDVVALLPMVDCGILIGAERESTIADLASAERMLEATNLLGIVLTKSRQQMTAYY